MKVTNDMLERAGHFPDDYRDLVVRDLPDGHVLVGYLQQDTDCENPLTSSDGLGAIYSSHRQASRESHRGMQDALGLDSSWGVDEDGMEDALTTFAKKHPALARRLRGDMDKAYVALRNLRLIGDPFVQPLDVYQHSGIAYLLPGQGPECRFDRANGAAVWVPDACARDEAQRRAQVYRFGLVEKIQKRGGTTYVAQLDGPKAARTPIGEFASWGEAFEALKTAVERRGRKSQHPEIVARGQARASWELAAEALSVYNAWLNGDCYGATVVRFAVTPESDDKDMTLQEIEVVDSVWGLLESAYAQQTLTEMVEAAASQKDAAVLSPA